MKAKLKYYAKEVIYFIIIMTIFANVISIYKSQSLNSTPLKLDIVKLLNQQSYTLPSDKPILVHFWATWCPTCRMEAGNIQRLSEHFEVISIAVKSGSDDEIQEYMKEHNLNFKVINDIDGTLAAQFHISAFPTTFIYDTYKNSVFNEVGYTSTLGLYLRMWWTSLK